MPVKRFYRRGFSASERLALWLSWRRQGAYGSLPRRPLGRVGKGDIVVRQGKHRDFSATPFYQSSIISVLAYRFLFP